VREALALAGQSAKVVTSGAASAESGIRLISCRRMPLALWS